MPIRVTPCRMNRARLSFATWQQFLAVFVAGNNLPVDYLLRHAQAFNQSPRAYLPRVDAGVRCPRPSQWRRYK